MKKKWFLKGAIALGIAVGFSVNDVSAEKKYVFAAHELPAGGNKAGTVFYFPSVTIGVDKDGKEVVIMDTVAINEENGYGTPATAQGMDTTGFAYVVKITKPWAKNKAGEATLLSLKFGKKYDFKDANAKTITIPEFVWAHDKERSGDEAYPSYKITAVADTVLKALVVSIDGKITYFGGDKKASEGQFKELIISGNVPTVLGSGKIKDYGLLNDTTFRVKIVPSWAVLKDNKTVIAGSTFYDTAKAGVEGAESIVRDLNFGLSRDNRDLEVSKEDLATIVAFIAPATSPVQASGKDKGKLIKKSVATLFIGDNLKTIYKFTPTDGTEITINDRLPNKWLHLASNAFKADSLTWRFHNIIFGSEVSGNLGEAGFAALGGIPTLVDTASNKGDTSDFGKIDLSEVKLTTEEGGQFALEGEGLFEGLRIDTLNLPAKLKIVGNKWFKDATIDTLGATGLGKSLIAIGDEAFRNAFIGNGFTFLGNLGTAATYSKTSPTIDLTTIENGLTIGKAAFKGYNLWKYPIPAINQGATFDLGAFQRATVIGDSAFADITYGHLRFEEDGTIDEDNSFVSDTSSNGTKKNPPFYYFPVTNFDTLVHVQSLGQGVFANDRIHIKKEAASFDSTYYAIKLPFKILNKAQADVFKSVAFVTDGNPLAHDSLYKDTYKDTIPFHAFTFPIGVAPGAEISKNAFPDDTIYVYYTTFEKWKYALTGSKLVSDYGFEGRGEADANKWLVKIVTGSTGVVSNVKDGKRGEFEITYAFAHNSRARTISFYNAYQAAKRWYTIEGPESAKIATPGFLTEGKKEITEAFAEDGIVLDPFTPAGLYTIKVYDLDQKSGDSTYLLRILPADLARYKAEPVSLGYVGKENIVEALKHKFPNGLYFNIKNEYEEIEDLHHEAAEVKVYEEAALELKAGDEPSTSVLVVKGLGSYVNELPIELSYTARDLKDVTFDIAPVDFKIGEKEFKIPGDLKFTV
ncbi:MAG: hypothetical protein LBU08_04115, partial [Tannerellaceae bacterium]|nr:hypothetical protein [Tannerellaceae bacterium]